MFDFNPFYSYKIQYLGCFLFWFCFVNVVNDRFGHFNSYTTHGHTSRICEKQEHLSQLYERRVVWKTRVIVDNNSHVLAKYYEILSSGRRFRVPKSNLQSIAFLNR